MEKTLKFSKMIQIAIRKCTTAKPTINARSDLLQNCQMKPFSSNSSCFFSKSLNQHLWQFWNTIFAAFGHCQNKIRHHTVWPWFAKFNCHWKHWDHCVCAFSPVTSPFCLHCKQKNPSSTTIKSTNIQTSIKLWPMTEPRHIQKSYENCTLIWMWPWKMQSTTAFAQKWQNIGKKCVKEKFCLINCKCKSLCASFCETSTKTSGFGTCCFHCTNKISEFNMDCALFCSIAKLIVISVGVSKMFWILHQKWSQFLQLPAATNSTPMHSSNCHQMCGIGQKTQSAVHMCSTSPCETERSNMDLISFFVNQNCALHFSLHCAKHTKSDCMCHCLRLCLQLLNSKKCDKKVEQTMQKIDRVLWTPRQIKLLMWYCTV